MGALFGFQLISTVIIGLFMSKIFSRWSWGLLIFKGLTFYIPPVTDYLGQFSQAYKDHLKKKGKKGETKKALEEFTIPKESEIKLKSMVVEDDSHIHLMSHVSDIDNIILLYFASLCVYLVTESYLFFYPSSHADLHLAYIWSAVVVFFCTKFLFYMVIVYLQLKGGEQSLCILATFVFLVLALTVNMTNEDIIGFGITEGYTDFSLKFSQFANSTGVHHDLNMPSVKFFKGCLSVVAALTGAMLTFPNIRIGNLNNRLLNSYKDSPVKSVLLHFTILSPLLITISWIKPFAVNHIRAQVDITEDTFELCRLGMVLLIVMSRALLIRLYTQSHLNVAIDGLETMRKEAGRVSYKSIQAKVSYTFQYSGVVALQILIPCIVISQLCFITLSILNTPVVDSGTGAGSEFIPVAINAASIGFRSTFTRSFMLCLLNYMIWWLSTCCCFVSLLSTTYYHLVHSV